MERKERKRNTDIDREKQGRIRNQPEIADGWAGAVKRVSRGSILVDSAQQS